MVQQRRRSVPARAARFLPPSPPPSQVTNLKPTQDVVGYSSSSASTSTSAGDPLGQASKLMSQADALAKMTFELNLRAVSAHAQRLECDVQKLVHCTAEDQGYRRENEGRLTKMMHEIQTVKSLMAKLEGRQAVTQADVERLQRDMSETTSALNGNFQDIRDQLSLLSRRIDLGSSAGSDKNNDQISPAPPVLPAPRMETRAMLRKRVQEDNNYSQKQRGFSLPSSVESRINETISSTKRWNREHKMTQTPDAQFIANYLKKQGQRDPGMAKLLQRTMQKRAAKGIRAGSGDAWRPQSLEELCRHLSWQEVVDTAKSVLVVDKQRTLRVLQ
ncbi:hypothetical protein FZEAL_567 [Fusarium zealandicum]|uniref:Uncharacterized protein n=1 Tax=Fusarium zealandicum TaxID=1053134 RepID=A0A8H4UV41_9HYPO|nr:hypothetical protein FZEAL_567 [Fusarium zealandicum]